MKKLLILWILVLFPIPAFSTVNIPTLTSLSNVTQTTMTANWSGDTEADGYHIYWGTTESSLDKSDSVGQSSRQYVITGLATNTTYYVAVSAYDNSGESAKSNIKSATTLKDTTIPSTPSGFDITSIDDIAQHSVKLKWDKNTEADFDHYNIYYGTTSGSYDSEGSPKATEDNTNSITVFLLKEMTRYFFAITAVDTSGNESEKSYELIVDTLEDILPPYIPVFTAEMSDINAITVRLSDNNSHMVDYAGSIFYYGTVPGNYPNSYDIGSKMSVTIDNLPSDRTWYITALSYDVHENKSEKSDEVSVKLESVQSFLGQDGDFDGGCFIQAFSSQSGVLWYLWLPLLISGILISLIAKKLLKLLITCIFFVLIILSIFSVNANAGDLYPIKDNLAGISVGYLVPSKSDFKDYYDDTIFPVFGFYERKIYKFLSADIEAGYFKENGNMLTVSGAPTEIGSEIWMVPVSASLKVNQEIFPYIIGYIGAGPDYWYCREKVDIEISNNETDEWVGGYHGVVGVKLYNMDEQFKNTGAIVECVYSKIDRFGENDLDIGGLTVKLGLFYQF